MSGGACLVYVTASSKAEAAALAEAVVGERLAACANVLGDIQSIFFWDGAVRSDGEVALLLKTAVDRLDDLTARIAALHSYDEPCVIALPIIGGSADFVDWIERETREPGS